MAKILYFITQAEFGGAQRYVFDLANNLKNDHETAVAFGEAENNLKLAKILKENGIKYFAIPHLKRSISPFNDILALIEIIKLVKKYRPDIIHLNSSKISILGSLASWFIHPKLRVIYTAHGWVFNEPLPLWQKRFYLWAEKFTARFKDKIICVSDNDRQTALRQKIAPAEKLVTIHNGLAPINFYSTDEAKKIIDEQCLYVCHPGLDPGSRINGSEQVSGLRVRPAMTNNLLIGSIGNLYKTKGYEYLIEAAHLLMTDPNLSFPRRRESRFIIIGDGAERKNLENLIKKYNLQNNFILAGQIDEAARLLPALDIYVCSSVKEGFPYSILEAMSAGLPIVSTSVGGIPEMIENPSTSSPRPELGTKAGQATGLLIKPADAEALALQIKTLLDNKNLRAELGQRAKEKVTTEFGLGKMVEATKKIYF